MSLPQWAAPQGKYQLDRAIELIYEQWRAGNQIVLLVGAGISSQSGYPPLGPLGLHLLTLYALQRERHELQVPNAKSPLTTNVYSFERDAWPSPSLFHEYFGVDSRKVIANCIKARLDNAGVAIDLSQLSIVELTEFAQRSLGLSWFNVLGDIAGNRPELIDALFDGLGTHVTPGPAHNLLSQFVTWFNVRLVLTTNFDTLIEQSLRSEAQIPYVFDVHVEGAPPPKDLVRKHLSVVKLHGSHHGIRADQTVNAPLNRGHLQTMLEYFEPNCTLVVLDYGGGDSRVMDLLHAFMGEKKLAPKAHRRVIRVDALSASRESAFGKLASDHNAPGEDLCIYNLYYPHSRLFLLDVFQKCTATLPTTHTRYPAIPNTPAPFKEFDTFGAVPDYAAKTEQSRHAHADEVGKLLSAIEGSWAATRRFRNGDKDTVSPGPYNLVVVTGNEGSGVSQVLAELAERLFKTHQSVWCDLDEAISVGTIVSWLYAFVITRQPDLPSVPLPLDLPVVDAENEFIDVIGLAITVHALWNRLKRDSYLIIIDSVSYAMEELNKPDLPETLADPRLSREAVRLMLFLAMLAWCANRCDSDSQCTVLIGTHSASQEDLGKKALRKLAEQCKVALLKEAALERLDHPISAAYTNGSKVRHGSKSVGKNQEETEAFRTMLTKAAGLSINSDDFKDDTYDALRKELCLSPLDPDATIKDLFEILDLISGLALVPQNKLEPKVLLKVGMAGSDLINDVDGGISVASSRRCRRVMAYLPSARYAYAYHGESLNSQGREFYSPKEACDYLNGLGPATEWSDNEDLRVLNVTGKDIVTFLAEAATCNRPRAWCQILELPSVKALGKKYSRLPPTTTDNNTRAAKTLVQVVTDYGFLRRQQGGFYYMDGQMRTYLRRSGQIDIESKIKVHQKMHRYYDRAYNVSGDITALNYFYWHALQCIKLTGDREGAKSELARGLLENTASSRGHLNAYDHTFLLLRLSDNLGMEKGKRAFSGAALGIYEKITSVLLDLYEDHEDVTQSQVLYERDVTIPTYDDWHLLQKDSCAKPRSLPLLRCRNAGSAPRRDSCLHHGPARRRKRQIDGICSGHSTQEPGRRRDR